MVSRVWYTPIFSDLYQNSYQLLTNEIESNTTNSTDNNESFNQIDITYTAFEILVAVIAVIGNLMVIIVFKRDRKLRRRTNYYIISLAVADLLVGLFGVPFAILSSIGLPTEKYTCLFSLSTLIILCTISIFCLVAVSVDRYWAILYPMAYSRNVRTKTTIGIISMCWFFGTIIGLLPLVIHQDYKDNCYFEQVMDYNYLLFLYFATIITPALLLIAFYAHIYRVIVKQIKQIVTMNPIGEPRCSVLTINSTLQHKTFDKSLNRCNGGTMLRVLGAARKRDVKATQNLSIIVLFFMICWIPLYTINAITAFNQSINIHVKFKMFCIILTHLNSAVNPILYAYHLKDFRAALKSLILKIFGIDNEQPSSDLQCRLSLASQHKLHSITDKRTSLQNRLYIDSPVWLKQQQLKHTSAISCSLNSIHNTATVVATGDIHNDIWQIVEIPSHGTCDHNYDNNKSRSSSSKEVLRSENLSQYSYTNKNFSSSLDDLEIYEDVFLPKDANDRHYKIRKSVVSLFKEKLQSNESINSYDIESKNFNKKRRKTVDLSSTSTLQSYSIGSFKYNESKPNSTDNVNSSIYQGTKTDVQNSSLKSSNIEQLNKTNNFRKYSQPINLAKSISYYTKKDFDQSEFPNIQCKYFEPTKISSKKHSSLYEIYDTTTNNSKNSELVPDKKRRNTSVEI